MAIRATCRLRRTVRWLRQLASFSAISLMLASAVRAEPLTLAVADVLPYTAPVLIAEAEGYFGAEGLNLTVKHFPVGRVCLEKLLAGEAHFATVADVPIMVAGFTRRDFNVLATTTLSGRENQIVIRADRGIQSPADLRGKRMGVVTGTSGHYYADTFLLYHGLKHEEVTEVALDPKDSAGPLVRGEVDAAALFGTNVTDALNRLGAQGRVLASPAFFSVSFNIVSRPASAGVSDDDAVKFLRAVQRAVALIQKDPERAQAIVTKSLKLSPGDLARTWNDSEFRVQLSQNLVTTLEAQARWALRRKLVPAGPVPDYLDLVRIEPLKRLDPRAVGIVK